MFLCVDCVSEVRAPKIGPDLSMQQRPSVPTGVLPCRIGALPVAKQAPGQRPNPKTWQQLAATYGLFTGRPRGQSGQCPLTRCSR